MERSKPGAAGVIIPGRPRRVAQKKEHQAPELPRVGMQFAIPGELNRIRWHGRGPQENYGDRKSGAAVGIHHNTVNVDGWPMGVGGDNSWVSRFTRNTAFCEQANMFYRLIYDPCSCRQLT
jgi:hypothetical protein